VSRGGSFFMLVVSLAAALVLQLVELPDAVAALRPLWLAMTLGYWALSSTSQPILPLAWLTGLCCDVLYDAPLGQHALGLVTVVYAVRKLRGTLIVFPLWQATLLLAPVWALYVFLMFWIDGLSDHPADLAARWLPLLTTTLLWPLAATLLSGLSARRSHRRAVLP